MKLLNLAMLTMSLLMLANCSNSPYSSDQLHQLKMSSLRADYHMMQRDTYSIKIPAWTSKPSRVRGSIFAVVGQAATNINVNTDRLCEIASLDARGKALQAIQESLHVIESKDTGLTELDYRKSIVSDTKGIVKHASEARRFATKRKRFTEQGFLVEKICFVEISIPVAVYEASMRLKRPAKTKF